MPQYKWDVSKVAYQHANQFPILKGQPTQVRISKQAAMNVYIPFGVDFSTLEHCNDKDELSMIKL